MTATEAQAAVYLDRFAEFTEYQHGTANPFLRDLRRVETLPVARVSEFLSIWYSFSRCTPQVLLACAATYPERRDRQLLMENYLEEDGLAAVGQDPHYELLEQLIAKIGGRLQLDPDAEALTGELMALMRGLTAPRATGIVSGFEHPALDIVHILMGVIERAGFPELVHEDPYLTIHVQVEPSHIVWAHTNSLRYMAQGHTDEVLAGFRPVMQFWKDFWSLSASRLLAH